MEPNLTEDGARLLRVRATQLLKDVGELSRQAFEKEDYKTQEYLDNAQSSLADAEVWLDNAVMNLVVK